MGINYTFRSSLYVSTIVVLVSLLFYSSTCAQSTKIDSLESALEQATDSNKVIALIQLGKTYRHSDTDKAFEKFNEALELSKHTHYKKGEVSVLYQLGLTNGMMGNYPDALLYFNSSLDAAKIERYYSLMSSAYSGLGIVYKRIGNYAKSLEYYKKNLAIADSLNDNEGVADVYSNLGVLYDLMKEPEKALEYYNNALIIFDEINDLDGISTVNANIAVLYFNDKNYEKALEKFKEGLAFANEVDNQFKICNSNLNIGVTYIHLEKYDEAFDHLINGLIVAEKLSLKQEKVTAFHNLALLRFKQKRFADAVDLSDKNIQATQEIQSFDLKRQAHYLAYEINEASNNFPKAIKHINLYIQYKDSLFNENKVNEFEKQQVQFEVYKKDSELAEQHLQLVLLNTRVSLEKKLRWAFAGLIVLLLVLLFLIFKRYVTKNRINAILTTKNELISKQKSKIVDMNAQLEKRMLRAQMNPHFIFNSLNSIQHLITNNEKQSALKYLTKFSNLLRQILESSINLNVVLAEEIRLLTIYIELESLRFDQNFKYAITIDDELDIYLQEVPVLLVQPYVENAIIHGLIPKEGNRELNVAFKDADNYVQCIITDNGIGRAAASKLKAMKNINPSRGMSVTEQRLASLHKNNEPQKLVDIEDLVDVNQAPSGTRVTVNIPKN